MAKYYTQVDGRVVGFDVLYKDEKTVVRLLDEEREMQVDFAAVHASPATGEGLSSLVAGGKGYQG